eukprot:gnl/TRDRNA2_/TRDRNA2_170730_c3_seq3.p2 gnl/TRDRNA2_/TRDRNA2_170730_c3~~gnl/TRDRNA2_/TRDRNA2_170730_c3_seq3.p2  ORF type:complete len:106 (+),score=7.89 gnl/TRDRNA2_/TRDRNA2_170730_c3_seq3:23-319(+)
MAVERRLRELNPHGGTKTVWAFATANYRDEKLFAVLAGWGCQRSGDFHSQCHIRIALWAFSRREHVVVLRSPASCSVFERLLLYASLRCFAREELEQK